ncbi:hypothetical protein ACKWTF_004960 [Chironomus riparius]
MESSDGEIKDDFSDISEEDYFDSIASKIEKRKLELELLNSIEAVYVDDYAKENRFENHRNRQNTSRSNFRKEKSRKPPPHNEIRNRAYRASSIFSTGYTLPKRKRQRRRRKYSKLKSPPPIVYLSSPESPESVVEVKESESDEELLLRLQALTSKKEVKSLIEPNPKVETIETPHPSPTEPAFQTNNNSNEEELLRIAALRSAILKKKDHFRKRKQLRKLESERPYSPDNFEPIIDVAMDLSNSPLGSPFHNSCDINEEIDMDISNSPSEVHENLEACDMELVYSPQSKHEIVNEENDEELELRSMLLSSINVKKRKSDDDTTERLSENELSEPASPQLDITNLKMAVERLKQQKHHVPTLVSSKSGKSGTKTIKMILEEQKNKKLIKDTSINEVDDEIVKSTDNHELTLDDNNTLSEIKNEQIAKEEILEPSETSLIDKISTSQSPQNNSNDDSALDKVSLTIEPSDSSFSTITDTKNIPLLPEKKKVENRLVTSLDSVIRPVTPLIIKLYFDSSEDEYDKREKKTIRKVIHAPKSSAPDFQMNLDSFLKNIRSQQELSQVNRTTSKTSPSYLKENAQISPKTSAVKHLPLSSQVEYEKLVQKMKILQEAKQQRQKAGTLKRTKSSSEQSNPSQNTNSSNSSKNQQQTQSEDQQKVVGFKELENKSTKIDDALGKIPLLDEAARSRLIEKTEINYLNHTKNLLESTESNIKLLDENSLEFKRKDKIESKIAEFEKSLIKYKNYLRVVNTRIKTNTPKILQSQRDMIKLRNHQFKFGQICQKVGETVRGDSYILPDCETSKIENNFLKISEKTEEIHKVVPEDQAYVSKQLKLLADKVKEFSPKVDISKEIEATNNAQVDSDAKNTKPERAIIRSVSQLIAACNNDENEIEEKLEKSEVSVEDEQSKAPEVHRNVKRVLENIESTVSMKKMKHYESPLEFLKLPHMSNRKSVNQIICPYSMEGTCNDLDCKYFHL